MIFKVPTLILFGVISGAAGLWVADRDPPTTRIRAPEVINSPVEPGGTLKIKFYLFRHRLCSVRTERTLYDSQGVRFSLPPVVLDLPPQGLGEDIYTSAIPIPKEFAPGEAWYKVSSTYSCNIVHRLFWPIPSNPQDIRFVVQ